MTYTVGDLARLTGLTPRALHHYEELGLLRPSGRSEGGYRLYDEGCIAQLHAVLAYRYLGLPLKEIAALLAEAQPPLRELLQRQAALVEERIAQHERLLHALRHCTTALKKSDAGVLEDKLLGVITAMRLCEATLLPEEHRAIAEARKALSEADVAALKAEFAKLIRALDAQRLRGADPASARVLDITRRLGAMRERIAGTDPALHEKIREIGRQAPQLMRAQGISPELAEYGRAAREALEALEALERTQAPSSTEPAKKKPARAKRSAA